MSSKKKNPNEKEKNIVTSSNIKEENMPNEKDKTNTENNESAYEKATKQWKSVLAKNQNKYSYKPGQRVAVIFSGGPASGANSVISSLALNFSNAKIPLIGFIKGYEYIEHFSYHQSEFLQKGAHYIELDSHIAGIRGQAGVSIKTSRANPGKNIKEIEDLNDEEKNKMLYNILEAFKFLNVGALISIGGDDTLKTANFFHLLGFPVIHVPKTIDNDYFGIPWTFGYWSAVEVAKEAIINLGEDCRSTDSYFVVELMGRKAGWITYATGIAAKAMLMLANEDFADVDTININEVCKDIVDQILAREAEGKFYGMICIAEGLVDKLPDDLKPKEVDRHGNIIFGKAELCRIISESISDEYKKRTGRKKKITPKQIGYETRCVRTSAFDINLGCMLGFGAFQLFKKKQFGHMVSVEDNFNVKAIPFNELIDPITLMTKLRGVPPEADLFKLKEALSYRAGSIHPQ